MGRLIGLLAHSVLLPAVAFGLTMVLQPAPSIALGMLLVALCPSGNISNFLVNYGHGNTALSVTIAAFSMLGSIVFPPFNLSFWGELNPYTRPILHAVTLSPWEVFGTIVVLLAIPTALGMFTAHHWPAFARRIRGTFRALSLGFFALFVVGALVVNWDFFLKYVERVVLFVFLLNAFALLTGYLTAKAARLPEADRRAVALEVGIQNSGFGLVLVFFRRPGWHGDRGGVVGHLAHRRGHLARRLVAPAPASAAACRGRRMCSRRILVTGSAGYLGSTLLKALAAHLKSGELDALVASDVRETPAQSRLPGIEYVVHDVRSPGLASLLTSHSIESVVHLAAIVTPGARSSRELEYAVEPPGPGCLRQALREGRRGQPSRRRDDRRRRTPL